MKLNSETNIFGKLTILVPYKSCHVDKYHHWMEDVNLRELTASEALTIEEEYAMQRSWCEDPDKCTFIILHRQKFECGNCSEVDAMVGDVNLFFNVADDKQCAELEVMIAERDVRGQGLGKEAALSMIYYAISYLGVKRFVVKIGTDNLASLSLFKKLGFNEVSRSDVFKEVTMTLETDEAMELQLKELTKHINISQSHTVR